MKLPVNHEGMGKSASEYQSLPPGEKSTRLGTMSGMALHVATHACNNTGW